MDPSELTRHVSDATEFHFPWGMWHLPAVQGFQLTKFMVLELLVGLVMLLVFIPLARRIRTGAPPRGITWNLFEAVLVFIRDEMARPAIGSHDAGRFLPFLWNTFFFILFCNLMGIVPWAGSPTAAMSVTAALAAMAFLVTLGGGVAKCGFWGFVKGLVPHMELPWYMWIPMVFLIFPLEVLGLLIRHAVLAVRLLANMFGGHLALAAIVGFIAVAAQPPHAIGLWAGVTLSSVLGAAALTLLEIFVAFLQAYVFTFLSALFIGMAVHPH
jgi:F-type H+-transporting ATPase subunit a